jgi:hypothetical protein
MSAHVGDLPATSDGSLLVFWSHPGRPLADATGEGDEAHGCCPGVVAGRSGRTERGSVVQVMLQPWSGCNGR